MDLTQNEVKIKLMKDYSGRFGIHGIGVQGGVLTIYHHGGIEMLLMAQIQKDAKPFTVEFLDASRMFAAGE